MKDQNENVSWKNVATLLAIALNIVSTTGIGYLVKTFDDFRAHQSINDSRITKLETQVGFIINDRSN